MKLGRTLLAIIVGSILNILFYGLGVYVGQLIIGDKEIIWPIILFILVCWCISGLLIGLIANGIKEGIVAGIISIIPLLLINIVLMLIVSIIMGTLMEVLIEAFSFGFIQVDEGSLIGHFIGWLILIAFIVSIINMVISVLFAWLGGYIRIRKKAKATKQEGITENKYDAQKPYDDTEKPAKDLDY